MADYDSHLDLLPTGLAQPEVPVNSLFNAMSPASLFGRQDYASAALTWGYYGGVMMVAGVPTTIANGTVTLTASATNYVEATTAGVVSTNTSAFTGGRIPLYIVTTNTTGPTNWVDKRPSALGMEGSTAVGEPVETQEEGATVNATTSTINFVGAGVTATDAGGGTTTVTIPGGGGGAIRVEDEGSSVVAAATALNFVGAGVTVTDAGSNEATVTIAGGGGGPTSLGESIAAPAYGLRFSKSWSRSLGANFPSDLTETQVHPGTLGLGNRFDAFPRYKFAVAASGALSAGGIGAESQSGNNNGFLPFGNGFDIEFVFGFNTMNSDSVFYVGLWGYGIGAVGFPSNELGARADRDCFMLGFDTAHTAWQIFSNDNVGLPAVTAVSGTWPRPTVQNQMYRLRLRGVRPTTQVDWWLTELVSGNAASGAVTTSLPQATRLMRPMFSLGNGNTAVISEFVMFAIDGVVPW